MTGQASVPGRANAVRDEGAAGRVRNVVSTAHAAGSSDETQQRIARGTAEQLVDVLAGKPPRGKQ